MKTFLYGLITIAALTQACGDDDDAKKGGGKGGTGGSSASGGTGGTGGSGGTGATGGATGGTAGTDGGVGGSAGAAGSAGADGGTSKGRLLVAGTDFFSSTEIATIDLDTMTVAGSATFTDGDAVPAASGPHGFVLERTAAKVHSLTTLGAIDKTYDVGKAALGDSGAGTTNPVAVANTASKVYVTLNSDNRLPVFDAAAATLTTSIDLSSHLDSADADGAVEAGNLLVSANKLYFTLGRIDRTTVAPPDFQLACPSTTALMATVDVATDVLDGTVALPHQNPIDAYLDTLQNRIVILSAGCFETTDAGKVRVQAGIASYDLATKTATALYTSTSGDFLSRFIWLSASQVLVNTFDASFGEHWYSWDPAQTSLGAELTGVPSAASGEDAGHLLGVSFLASDAGTTASIDRYDATAMTSAPVVAAPFSGSFSAASGSVIAK
jgi:hypothetical protein